MSYADLVQRAWRNNVLLTAHLELTYACNLDCHFCYNDRARPGSPLATAEWLSLVDDLAELQVLNLVLSGGEPTVHPDFFALGSHARRRGFVVRIKTNGILLRGAWLDRLIAEIDPFVLEVSLHGACAATHDRQTRVAGSFERLMENLHTARGRVRLQLNAPLTLWNEGEVADLVALARELELPLRIDPEVTPRDDGSLAPLEIAPSASGLRRWLETEGVRAAPVVAPNPHGTCTGDRDKHCGAGSATVLVDPFGNVMPCVQWRRTLGNVRTTPLARLWRSAALHDAREALVQVKRETGGEVDHCPGVARAITGSLSGRTEQQSRRDQVRRALRVIS